MERILYFDCFAGISGDMSLGALIDLGLDYDAIINEIRKLNIDGYEIEIKRGNRFSITGTDVKVNVHEEFVPEHHHHNHEHRERSLDDIILIINSSDISKRAKEIAINVFTEIAKAEAIVHNKSIKEVHFHEVGAIDSIVDIVGTAICLDMLKIDRIYCSPVHEGKGFVNCRHGMLPVPVPAVMQMLRGSNISIIAEDIEAELVTPTGFGILKTVSQGCRKIPEMLIEGVGYGFGKTETGRLNALRVILGKAVEAQLATDKVVLLETNIDDSTGEILGYTMDQLLKEGALDVFFTSIYMKKNRPAFMLSVLCNKYDVEKLSNIILSETSTIGIRIRDTERLTLDRNIKTVETELGRVRVKSVVVGGLERIQPEYEDCINIAKENNLSLNQVYEIVKRS